MSAHGDKVADAKMMAESFRDANHFLSDELTQKTLQIVQRFDSYVSFSIHLNMQVS